MVRISTIDAHVAGQPLRLIVGGVSTVHGDTMAEKLADAATRIDWARCVVLEPRGHRDLVAAMLTEPCSPDADAGLLVVDSAGWSSTVDSGVMAAVALARTRGLLVTGRDAGVVRIETPDRIVETRVDGTHVTVVGSPATVRAGGVELRDRSSGAARLHADARRPASFRIDVVEAGGRFMIADAEAVGVPLDLGHLDRMRDGARLILQAWQGAREGRPSPFWSVDAELRDTVIFTSPADGEADLRAVPVAADGLLDRSPSVSGVCALMAVLDAMALVPDDRPVLIAGLAGLTLSAVVVGRQEIEGQVHVTSEVTGRAWVTGEHTFMVDPDDPLPATDGVVRE